MYPYRDAIGFGLVHTYRLVTGPCSDQRLDVLAREVEKQTLVIVDQGH